MLHINTLFYIPIVGVDIIAIVAFYRGGKRNISILGVCLFAVSLLFTVWGTLLSSKGWLAASVLFSILGSILFAAGWDKVKDYVKVSQIVGNIKFPEMPYVFNAIIKLESMYGTKKTYFLQMDANGRFAKGNLPPAMYKLTIEGDYLVEQCKMVEIHPKSTANVGNIEMKFHFPYIRTWKDSPRLYIQSLIQVSNKFWVMGHEYISDQHHPKIYKYEDSYWVEKTIDSLLGSVSIISSILNDDFFVVGSSGKGAAFSVDWGETWAKLPLPNGGWYFGHGIQLRNGSWLFRADNGYPMQGSSNIILRTKGFEKWDITFKCEAEILSLTEHSLGKIVVSTRASSNQQNAKIYYSDTNGEKWERAILPNGVRYKAINGLFELENGDLLAGTSRGGEKEGFDKKAVLLISKDGGVSWEHLMDVPIMGEVTGIYESSNKDLFIFGDRLLVSPFGTKELYTVFPVRVHFLRVIDGILYMNNFQNIHMININDLEVRLKRV